MQISLYRKFRPKAFSEVIGQEHIVKALSQQVKTGNISHAYLFCGTRGTGKTTCAKIFARAINCLENNDGSPCYKCKACLDLMDPSSVDIMEIDGASNNGVDQIRSLRENVKYPPINCKYKVIIIDEVHMLSDSAFNALLKTLEEPPSHVVFILATTEVYKLPSTILSRCMRFDFRLVDKLTLENHLKSIFDKINVKYDEKSIEAIALSAEGSVRDMLSNADSVLAYSGEEVTYDKVLKIFGSGDRESVFKLCDSIFKKDLGEVLEDINEIFLSGKNLYAFTKEMTNHFKDLIVVKTCKNARQILNVPQDVFDKLAMQEKLVSQENLLYFMQKFSQMENELRFTLSPRTLLELNSLECASFDTQKKN